MPRFANVHVSTGDRYFVDDAHLVLQGKGSMTLVRNERRMVPDLKTILMLKDLIHSLCVSLLWCTVMLVFTVCHLCYLGVEICFPPAPR